MGYLIATVAIVGVLCLSNLVLAAGLIRRLRLHTDQLNRLLRDATRPDGVPVGERIGDFAATTIDGEPVSRELLTNRTLVGFFSPGCQPCATQLPRFVEYARSMPYGAGQVLAVVDGAGGGDADYAATLTEVARVVIEADDRRLTAAFQVAGFPMFYLLADGGVVIASGFTIADLNDEPEMAGHDR